MHDSQEQNGFVRVTDETQARKIFDTCKEEILQQHFGMPIPVEESDKLYDQINRTFSDEPTQDKVVIRTSLIEGAEWTKVRREKSFDPKTSQVEQGTVYDVRATKELDGSIVVNLMFPDPDRPNDDFSMHSTVMAAQYVLRHGQPIITELTGANNVIMEQAHQQLLWSLKFAGLDPEEIKQEDSIFSKINVSPQIYMAETLRFEDRVRDFERPELGIIEKAFSSKTKQI